MRSPDVIVTSDSGLGKISLNRPAAINALTLDMCRAIIAALQSWEFDPDIEVILIDHSEGRGFCAGGDIRALYEDLRGDGSQVADFFRTEYRLNHLLFTLAKPTVCFLDGVVMGGGAGLAMPCRFRIATENTTFAMPETGIGFFPDVGAGWFLARLPGRVGQWMALTGARLGGGDCLRLGLATHFLPHGALTNIKACIHKQPEGFPAILGEASRSPPPSQIDSILADIDRVFASDEIEGILSVLQADPSAWAREQLTAILKKSPRSSKVALRQLSRSLGLTGFADNMRMEYRLAMRLARLPDFAEGIRAFVIDKDNRPKWQPSRLEDVSDDEVEAMFTPLPETEEWTPLERE